MRSSSSGRWSPTPKLFPAVRFHKSLFKPKEVSNLLSAGGLDKPELQSISQPPPPPVVELLAPAERRVKHDKPTIVVRARAKAMGDDPILSMQLLINGVPAVPSILHSNSVKVFFDY